METVILRESFRTELSMDDGLFVIEQDRPGIDLQHIRLTRTQASILVEKLATAVEDESLWEGPE